MRPGVAMTRILLLGALAAGCATPQAGMARGLPPERPGAAVALTQASIEPKTLEARAAEPAVVRYEITAVAEITVDFVDDEGRVVRRLGAGGQLAGRHEVTWDGRTDDGMPVPRGVYRYVIRARDAQGQDAVYDPSGQTGGEELSPQDFTFEPPTGRLAWSMPKAGFARLRVGFEGFPHLRTLLDWEPLEAGPQSLAWDGLDASGLLKISGQPNLSVKLTVFAMPHNTIIVRGDDGPTASPTGVPPQYPPLRKDGGYFHARHARALCHEVGVAMEFPEAQGLDGDGRPIVSGRVPVRVTLDPRDAARLVNSRFEVVVFEGLTVLFEDEEGTTPFTFLWETSHLPPGTHLVTINVLSYDDHYGVVTRAVTVRPEARAS
jgi:hypothetical protein